MFNSILFLVQITYFQICVGYRSSLRPLYRTEPKTHVCNGRYININFCTSYQFADVLLRNGELVCLSINTNKYLEKVQFKRVNKPFEWNTTIITYGADRKNFTIDFGQRINQSCTGLWKYTTFTDRVFCSDTIKQQHGDYLRECKKDSDDNYYIIKSCYIDLHVISFPRVLINNVIQSYKLQNLTTNTVNLYYTYKYQPGHTTILCSLPQIGYSPFSDYEIHYAGRAGINRAPQRGNQQSGSSIIYHLDLTEERNGTNSTCHFNFYKNWHVYVHIVFILYSDLVPEDDDVNDEQNGAYPESNTSPFWFWVLVACGVSVIITITLYIARFAINRSKALRQQQAAEYANLRNETPPHFPTTPKLEEQYCRPADQQNNQEPTYAQPYKPKSLDELYSKPVPKNKRNNQESDCGYAEIIYNESGEKIKTREDVADSGNNIYDYASTAVINQPKQQLGEKKDYANIFDNEKYGNSKTGTESYY